MPTSVPAGQIQTLVVSGPQHCTENNHPASAASAGDAANAPSSTSAQGKSIKQTHTLRD